MMQRHSAPQGKPAPERTRIRGSRENLGFHSGVTQRAAATHTKKKKKQGHCDENGADERPGS